MENNPLYTTLTFILFPYSDYMEKYNTFNNIDDYTHHNFRVLLGILYKMNKQRILFDKPLVEYDDDTIQYCAYTITCNPISFYDSLIDTSIIIELLNQVDQKKEIPTRRKI